LFEITKMPPHPYLPRLHENRGI